MSLAPHSLNIILFLVFKMGKFEHFVDVIEVPPSPPSLHPSSSSAARPPLVGLILERPPDGDSAFPASAATAAFVCVFARPTFRLHLKLPPPFRLRSYRYPVSRRA